MGFIPSSMSRPAKDAADLPISQPPGGPPKIGLRRRFSSSSSSSVGILPLSAAWAFRRSKSMSSVGDLAGASLRRWWEWGWGWILSRRPTFARDLEMNDEETALLGFRSKGSWRHILHKIRKLVAGSSSELPVAAEGLRCESFSCAQPPPLPLPEGRVAAAY